MSEDRQQPSVGLCVAFVAILPVLYFVSLGPLAWVWTLTEPSTPPWLETVVEFYFAPATFVYDHSPEPIQQVMKAYVGFFSGEA
jgi:hypothetical protein